MRTALNTRLTRPYAAAEAALTWAVVLALLGVLAAALGVVVWLTCALAHGIGGGTPPGYADVFVATWFVLVALSVAGVAVGRMEGAEADEEPPVEPPVRRIGSDYLGGEGALAATVGELVPPASERWCRLDAVVDGEPLTVLLARGACTASRLRDLQDHLDGEPGRLPVSVN